MGLSCNDVISLSSLVTVNANGSVTIQGYGNVPPECCNATTLSFIDPYGNYLFQNGNCFYEPGSIQPSQQSSCQIFAATDFYCVGPSNFQSWNSTYIQLNNGQSIQQSNPILWNTLLNYVNAGSSFFVINSTAEVVLEQDCCSRIMELGGDSSFSSSENICRCNSTTPVPPPPVVTATTATTISIDYTLCDITDVQVVNSFDVFNNTIQIVVQKGTVLPINEACCNKLKDENSLPWTWKDPYCLVSESANCLPVTFQLNENLVSTKTCDNNIEISMWLYFGKPANSCGEITETEPGFEPLPLPSTGNTDTVGTSTDNTGAIDPNPITSGGTTTGTDSTGGLGDPTGTGTSTGGGTVGPSGTGGFGGLGDPTGTGTSTGGGTVGPSGTGGTGDTTGTGGTPPDDTTVTPTGTGGTGDTSAGGGIPSGDTTGGTIEDGTLIVTGFDNQTITSQNVTKSMTETTTNGFGGKNLLSYNKDYSGVINNKC